jgi:hypothetical protein
MKRLAASLGQIGKGAMTIEKTYRVVSIDVSLMSAASVLESFSRCQRRRAVIVGWHVTRAGSDAIADRRHRCHTATSTPRLQPNPLITLAVPTSCPTYAR